MSQKDFKDIFATFRVIEMYPEAENIISYTQFWQFAHKWQTLQSPITKEDLQRFFNVIL